MLIISRHDDGSTSTLDLPPGRILWNLPEDAVVLLSHDALCHVGIGIKATPPLPAPVTLPGFNRPMRPGTHRQCSRGHVRTPDNTYVRPNGQAECKPCKYAWHIPAA